MYPTAGQFDGVMGPNAEGPGLKPSAAVTNNAAASPVTAATYKEPGKGSGIMPAAPKAIDKSSWNRDIKVAPSVVAGVKDLGRGNMGANAAKDALAIKPRVVGGVLSSGPVAASVAQKEATKRVYPSAYRNAAGTNFKSSPSPSDIANIKR